MTTQSPIEDEPVIENLDDGRMIALRPYLIIAGVIALILLGVYLKVSRGDSGGEETTRKQHRVTVSDRSIDAPPIVSPVVKAQEIERDPVTEEVKTTPPPEVVYLPAETKIIYRPAPKPPTPRIAKGRSSGVTMIAETSTTSQPMQGGQGSQVAGGGNSTQAGQSRNTDDPDLPDDVARVYAGQLDNLDSMILQNTPIPCVLLNDINTQLPGKVSCVVSRDIWSADNSRILLAQGSKANGEYQSGTTSGAVTMIGVVWGRMKNTENMVANLDSPAAGPQGAAGIEPDYVNYHFWKKFSAAFAVSMIDGALRNVGSNDGNSQVVVNSATNTGQDILSQILQSTINIPATRKTHRGAELIIFLNKDISFERVL